MIIVPFFGASFGRYSDGKLFACASTFLMNVYSVQAISTLGHRTGLLLKIAYYWVCTETEATPTTMSTQKNVLFFKLSSCHSLSLLEKRNEKKREIVGLNSHLHWRWKKKRYEKVTVGCVQVSAVNIFTFCELISLSAHGKPCGNGKNKGKMVNEQKIAAKLTFQNFYIKMNLRCVSIQLCMPVDSHGLQVIEREKKWGKNIIKWI